MKAALTSKKFIIYNIFIVFIILFIGLNLRSLVFNNYWNEQKREYIEQSTMIEKAIHQYYHGESELQKVKENICDVEILTNSMINIIDDKGALNKELSSRIMNYEFTKDQLLKLHTDKFIDVKSEEFGFRDTFIYAISIFEDEKFIGAIVFNDFSGHIKSDADFALYVSMVFAIFIIVLSNSLWYIFFKKYIFEEVQKINFEAKLIAVGHREKRIDVRENYVLREIVESINSMAAELQRLDSEGKEIVSNVSHELRTPITSIRGFVQAIIDGIVPEENVGYYLEIVQKEMERLSRLINNLLDLSTYEANNTLLRLESFDVNQVIREVISIKENDIRNKNVFVDLSLVEERGVVLADRDKIFQVIVNILDNAIKYVYDCGIIRIETIVLENRLKVIIFNSGPCIEEENLKKIWNRFFKDEKQKAKSTGLGLAIVKHIMNLHGEKVWVENVGREGVNFIFTLQNDKVEK